MTNRLTPEALDALLSEHSGTKICPTCSDYDDHSEYITVASPCTIYLLASEVRDARPVIDVSKRQHLCIGVSNGHPICQICVAVAHYEEGTK